MTTTVPTATKHWHAQNGLGQAILTTTGGFIAIALAMTPQQEHAA